MRKIIASEFSHEKNYEFETKHEDNSFCPVDAPVDAPCGCRIGAAKTNYWLRAGGRSQNVLRSSRKRRSCGVAPRRVHGNFGRLERLDRRTFQNAESDCHRNAGPRAYSRHQTRFKL